MTDIIEILIEEEGFKPSAHQDHMGFWTIGSGICIDARKGCGITREENRYLMNNRLAIAWRELPARLPWFFALNEARRKALVLMAYQLGVDGVLDFKKMLAAMKDGDFARAADEALDSKWAKEDTPKRAYRVSQLIRDGE